MKILFIAYFHQKKIQKKIGRKFIRVRIRNRIRTFSKVGSGSGSGQKSSGSATLPLIKENLLAAFSSQGGVCQNKLLIMNYKWFFNDHEAVLLLFIKT
jgi:hypothetical protein